MKNIKIGILLILTSLVVLSCKDDSLSPIITFDQAGKGAYVRLTELVAGEFDLANFNDSKFAYKVEFVSETKGADVASYDVYVKFDDNNADNGDSSTEEKLFKSFGKSDLTTNGNGVAALSVSIPMKEVASLLGVAEADIKARDIFVFRSELKTDAGAVFTFDNSTSAVNGPAFQGFFNFSSKVTCPLSNDDFVGEYTLTYVEDPQAFGVSAFGHDGITVTLETIDGSTTLRKFSYEYLTELGVGQGNVDFTFDFVCDVIIPNDAQVTALSCGAGDITLGPSKDGGFSSFDLNNDGEFEITLDDFVSDGGCGVAPLKTVIKLTKK